MREFWGRVAVIATMYRKERAIGPILASALGVNPTAPPNFDTDAFGTFTRDIPRPADQRGTARLKAQAVLDLTGETLAIASEGSFNPHPEMPFVPCNRELVLLLDCRDRLEMVGQAIDFETNFRSQTIHNFAEAMDFARAVGFPEHGLVLMAAHDNQPPAGTTKGITTETASQDAVNRALAASQTDQAHIETDLRALHNPTRMRVIAAATQDLIRAIARSCPACGCPGFTIVRHNTGLPCSWCKTPTLETLSVAYSCQRCEFQQEVRFPNGRRTAEPGQCPFCNP